MEDRLSQLTEEFKKIYQENEFNEIKIDRIKTQLTNLTKELDQFRNVRIKKENTSFIEKFSVVVSSETYQEKKVNQIDLNKNQTKLTEDFNRSSNTSNPIDSSPLVDINSIHLSSVHDTGSRTDQTHQEFVDLQDELYGTDNERHATFSSDFENGSIDLLSSNNDGTSSTSVRFRNATNQHAHDDNKDTRASGKSTICTDINTNDRMPQGGQVVRRRRINAAAHHTRGKNYSSDEFNSGSRRLHSECDNICSGFNLNIVDCTTDSAMSPNDSKSSMFDKPSHRIDQYEGYDYNEKASFSGSKSDVASQNSNINDSDEFRNSSTRASFNMSGRMHRGRRGLYREQRRSAVRDNPGAGRGSASRNCFNCNKPGHFRRECPEERKLRDNGGDGKVKPIELNEETNVDTQVLSNTRFAHFEDLIAIQCYILPCIQTGSDKSEILFFFNDCSFLIKRLFRLFILPIISTLLQCHADELSNRKHPPSPLCLIISSTCERALQIECEARKLACRTAVVPYELLHKCTARKCSAANGHNMFTVSDHLQESYEADRMLDTGLEPDIRRLESLGLSSKEERITWTFSATFSNELQQLFTNGKYSILAVTFVIARGLDFPLIDLVVNYDLLNTNDFYIHRRADHLNKSILLFDPGRESDRKTAPELILKLSRVGQVIPAFLKKFGDVGNIKFYHDDRN
ncbi:unnamed protein product [Rotaria sordida]|uniref:CCHC-type domain-containing protein n=1 Tax=Rotaria sordida TaxID=392033 RepID=A0A815T5M0_9BILA|nr:unnamed protein product [Rotaria sordida]CAF1497595.1 unnamed protein product [Rotaria sordida]